MQNLFKKDSDQSSVHSTSHCFVTTPPCWDSIEEQTPQSSLSKCLGLDMGAPHQHNRNVKQVGLQLHGQDSSSTQSTSQSHNEVAAVGGSSISGKCFLSQSGCNETYGRHGEGHMGTAVALASPDFVIPPLQAEYNQTMARFPLPYAGSYFGGLLAAYGPQALIHPQMVGLQSARIPLPLDVAEDEPIYVNAKQYNGILRRRKSRAKLEAQNKLVKDRKPYLHESRHRHALKRPRGSGGRFLNTKKLEQKSEPILEGQDSTQLQLGGDLSESEVHQLENGKGGASTPACSDVTSVSNGDDIFRQPDLRFAGYNSHIEGTIQGGAQLMFDGHKRGVSIIQ